MKFNPIAFVINLAIPLLAGVVGSLLTVPSINNWYVYLSKPSFTPPNSVFAPVWTSLFILIGIAAYLVWQKRDRIVHFPRTVAIYSIQLVLNMMWSFLFFYAHSIGAALFEIIVLLIVIVINGRTFYKIDKIAGLLFIPYFLWVSYATALTASIFMLNSSGRL